MILCPIPPTAKEAAQRFGRWMRERRKALGLDQESAARRTMIEEEGGTVRQVISSNQWRRLEGSKSATRLSAPSPKEMHAIAVLALGSTVREALRAYGYGLDDSEIPAADPPDRISF